MALAQFSRLAPPSPFGPTGTPFTSGTDISGMSLRDRLVGLGVSGVQRLLDRGVAKKPISASDQAKLALLSRRDGRQSLVPGAAGACPGLFSVRGPDGRCINLGSALPGGDPFITPQFEDGQAGQPVLGRFGPAMTPVALPQTRLRCLPGQVLGRDNLCYEELKRKERKWAPPTRPLLTGGEVSALTKAASASGRIQTKIKALRKSGLFPKEKVCKSCPPKAASPQVVVVDTD